MVYFLSALAYLLFVFLRGVDFEDNNLDDFLEALDSGLESYIFLAVTFGGDLDLFLLLVFLSFLTIIC